MTRGNITRKPMSPALTLGDAGPPLTRGWDRKVEMVRGKAKATKQEINIVWIYPPQPERAAALICADPGHVTDL